MPRHLSGICFAVCAAALNATIGALSKLLISAGLTTSAIAFYKTAVAVIVVSFVLLLLKHAPRWRGSRAQWWQAAVCSMLGIFMLFFFETRAYQHTDAATAVVVLMASAALSAIVLGRFFWAIALIETSCWALFWRSLEWPLFSKRTWQQS